MHKRNYVSDIAKGSSIDKISLLWSGIETLFHQNTWFRITSIRKLGIRQTFWRVP